MKKLELRPLCICLDWDGTLVDCKEMIHYAYMETMEQLGINKNWSFEDTCRQNGRSPQNIFQDNYLWKGKEAQAKEIFYQEISCLKKEFPDLLQLKPGAKELLQKLRNIPSCPRIVLIANKTHDLLVKEVISCELIENFDRIIGSQHNTENDKPSPRTFERAVEGLNIINPGVEVIHIGDNPNVDPQFAANYGAISLLVADTPKANAKTLMELAEMF